MSAQRPTGSADQPAKGTLAETVHAVAWSFFGVRRSRDLERDLQRLDPLHVIVAGIAGAVVFVAALVLLVRWIVGSGVAV